MWGLAWPKPRPSPRPFTQKSWMASHRVPSSPLSLSSVFGRQKLQTTIEDFLSSLPLEARARVRSCGGHGSGLIFVSPPLDPSISLPSTYWRLACRERLGIPITDLQVCTFGKGSGGWCGAPLQSGLHLHTCSHTQGTRNKFKHNCLVAHWASFLRQAGHLVDVEQPAPSLGPSARLDIVQYPNENAGPCFYDVSVSHPILVSGGFTELAASSAGHAIRTHRTDKTRQCPLARPDRPLVPLVVETFGGS